MYNEEFTLLYPIAVGGDTATKLFRSEKTFGIIDSKC